MVKSQFKNEPKAPHTDALWQAGNDGNVRGPQKFIRRSVYTAAIVNPLASLLVVAGIAGAGFGIAAWNKR